MNNFHILLVIFSVVVSALCFEQHETAASSSNAVNKKPLDQRLEKLKEYLLLAESNGLGQHQQQQDMDINTNEDDSSSVESSNDESDSASNEVLDVDGLLEKKRSSGAYLRFGKRSNNPAYLRFGRSNAYLRFGKRSNNPAFIRFGRNPAFLRFGK